MQENWSLNKIEIDFKQHNYKNILRITQLIKLHKLKMLRN
jgi:hypothetical protein